jgi:REP element-mobilizing transposase RayT
MAFHIYRGLYFTTATVLNFYPLFITSKTVNAILSALDFLTQNNRAVVYSFVIMPNHLHLIWQVLEPYALTQVQHSLLSFSAKRILNSLKEREPEIDILFIVDKSDRNYQVWQRNALSIPIYYNAVLKQKLNYIHLNPVRAGLVKDAEDFTLSSYKSYIQGYSEFSFLTLF